MATAAAAKTAHQRADVLVAEADLGAGEPMTIDSRRPGLGAIIHSDQGVQYGSWAFTKRAKPANTPVPFWASWNVPQNGRKPLFRRNERTSRCESSMHQGEDGIVPDGLTGRCSSREIVRGGVKTG